MIGDKDSKEYDAGVRCLLPKKEPSAEQARPCIPVGEGRTAHKTRALVCTRIILIARPSARSTSTRRPTVRMYFARESSPAECTCAVRASAHLSATIRLPA